MKKRFLLFAYRASWKGIMGKKLVWFEVVGFACLRGEQRTCLCFSFPLDWSCQEKLCWPLDLHPHPNVWAGSLGSELPPALVREIGSPQALSQSFWKGDALGALRDWRASKIMTVCSLCKRSQMGGGVHLMQFMSCFHLSCLDVNKKQTQENLCWWGEKQQVSEDRQPMCCQQREGRVRTENSRKEKQELALACCF